MRYGVLAFDRSRRWFNETFGWSQDVETRGEIIKAIVNHAAGDFDQPTDWNPKWAYSVRYDEYRIYVQDDATLNWFVLSHPKTND